MFWNHRSAFESPHVQSTCRATLSHPPLLRNSLVLSLSQLWFLSSWPPRTPCTGRGRSWGGSLTRPSAPPSSSWNTETYWEQFSLQKVSQTNDKRKTDGGHDKLGTGNFPETLRSRHSVNSSNISRDLSDLHIRVYHFSQINPFLVKTQNMQILRNN